MAFFFLRRHIYKMEQQTVLTLRLEQKKQIFIKLYFDDEMISNSKVMLLLVKDGYSQPLLIPRSSDIYRGPSRPIRTQTNTNSPHEPTSLTAIHHLENSRSEHT